MEALAVTQLNLPERARQLYEKEGITHLYPPQAQSIEAGVLQGQSAVLAFPTAAGKTLVAELAMLKHVLENQGKALYLVPLKALASEKYDEFKKFQKLGIRVGISTGDFDQSDSWLGEFDIIIATNEKADSLLRHQVDWIKKITIIIADEVHLLNESGRGPTLEIALTRLRQVRPDAQFLALSATIKNADEIAKWLGAKTVSSTWRPVPLKEGVYFQGRILFSDDSVAVLPSKYDSPILDLAIDVVRGGGQSLVFTNTRRVSSSLAGEISEHLKVILPLPLKNELTEISKRILHAGEVTHLSQRLAEVVRCGVAFHHAGLYHEHRRIIENAFRENKIKIVCSTPTLAAGVNLPARRVVLQDYRRFEVGMGLYPIDVLDYKQMAGRAGRPEYDTTGEAILIARHQDEVQDLIETYPKGQPERIWSKLASEGALRTHILAAIATRYAKTSDELEKFLESTFYGQQYGIHTLRPAILNVMDFLVTEDLIRRKGEKLFPTPFGLRTSELYIDPLGAITIRKTLIHAKEAKPLGYLQLVASLPDLPRLYLRRGEAEKFEKVREEVAEELLMPPPNAETDEVAYEMYLSYLKSALLLKEWAEETPEDELLKRYDVGSGDIFSVTDSAEWLLHATIELASLLDLERHVKPLNALRTRVRYGIRAELLPLVQLRNIGRVRARSLYTHGYRDASSLSRAKPMDLTAITGIGSEVARSILEQVGNLPSEELQEPAKPPEKQQKLKDFME